MVPRCVTLASSCAPPAGPATVKGKTQLIRPYVPAQQGIITQAYYPQKVRPGGGRRESETVFSAGGSKSAVITDMFRYF